MHYDPATDLQMMMAMIELVGEAVDAFLPHLRRAAAQEVIRLEGINRPGLYEVPIFLLSLSELEERLEHASPHPRLEPCREPEPYPTDGITFPALVQIVRYEQAALAGGWLPEQLRALGLAIDQGELLRWLTPESAAIRDREGNFRFFYRVS